MQKIGHGGERWFVNTAGPARGIDTYDFNSRVHHICPGAIGYGPAASEGKTEQPDLGRIVWLVENQPAIADRFGSPHERQAWWERRHDLCRWCDLHQCGSPRSVWYAYDCRRCGRTLCGCSSAGVDTEGRLRKICQRREQVIDKLFETRSDYKLHHRNCNT
jgi:hypothetical protein